jgi:hypothetical protein
MSRFFPREAIEWGSQRLHPLRAFSLRAFELAGITGVALRLFRAVVLGTTGWVLFVAGLVAAVLFLCGMLTWHLVNYPARRWPARVTGFFVVESAAELGTSSLLIALGRERVGSRLATWNDWWPMAGQTLLERALVLALFALLLAGAVQLVRRLTARRTVDS